MGDDVREKRVNRRAKNGFVQPQLSAFRRIEKRLAVERE